MSEVPEKKSKSTKPPLHPFRRAVLRGLAVLLPPLLTVAILIWVWEKVYEPVQVRVEWLCSQAIVYSISDIRSAPPADEEEAKAYIRVGVKYIPLSVYSVVEHDPGPEGIPPTAEGVYRRYVKVRYLKWYYFNTVFLCLLVLLLYLLGKFLAAGVGRFIWKKVDQFLHRVPIIRNIYSSVQQVTDFVFSEREIEYTRVVAVEYPRKGIWSIGFVTGESMVELGSVANEPVMSVLMPTSPFPATGFTITIRKSDTVDINITVDQALQFVFSCGVVVPVHQRYSGVGDQIATAVAEHNAAALPDIDNPALNAPAMNDSSEN